MIFSIPFNRKVFQNFHLFVVPVLLENRGTFLYLPMIVDTGASYVTIRPDVFDRLGIRPVRTAPLVTASEQTRAALARADKITVGEHCSAVNVQMISIAMPAALPAEGLLGASFLRNFKISIDYHAAILEFATR